MTASSGPGATPGKAPPAPPPRTDRPRQALFPILPHRLGDQVEAALADTTMRGFVKQTTLLKDSTRPLALGQAFGDTAQVNALRAEAGRRKRETLAHLDTHLERFAETATRNGIEVHFASTAAQCNDLVVAIAKAHGLTHAVKAKSMVTEETQLLDRLLDEGIPTWETDLGELVLQLDDDAPSHLVTPMIHKDREAAARALSRLPAHAANTPLPPDPKTLTRAARAHLRERFEAAMKDGLGLTGANFLVAETGEIVTCTNEGNGRLSAMSPRVHIAIAGIERVVPTTADLALYLELLAKSSTGQPLTVYTSFVRSPRLVDEPRELGGPDAVHVILLDNGRTKVLAEPDFRDALGCLRCGACLNACPVYRTVGGHAYGSVWPGPIGKILTPLIRGDDNYPDLAWASTLCGACRESCPVDIDIPHMLVALRARAHTKKLTPWRLRAALKVARLMMGGRLRWRITLGLAGLFAHHELGPAKAFASHGRTFPRPEPSPRTKKARFRRSRGHT
jgi:L-lactate dehydrogenase complex protein LldF